MKTLRLLLLVFAVAFSFTSMAQIRFGVKGGVNIAKATFDVANVEDNFAVDNLTGFQLGPTMEAMLPGIGIGVDVGLIYSQRGFKLTDRSDGQEASTRMGYIDLPVNLKWKFGIPIVKVYLTAGPYISLKVSQNSDLSSLAEKGSAILDDVKAKSFSAGLNFGMGVEVFKHLQVGANYGLGLTEDYKSDKPKIGDLFHPKSSLWSITAAYYF